MRWVVSLLLVLAGAAPAWAQKPPTRFVAANPSYHGRGRGGSPIRHVVIHTVEGSAGSAMNTFRHGGRRVSAHYIVDFDGAITQMVRDEDTAWHAGRFNRHSIGIEHAGFAGRNKWTIEQYRASARLTRWLCDTYRIPMDRSHIVGHREVPGATHSDPGRYFDWDLYLRLVRGEAGAADPGPATDAPEAGAAAPAVTAALAVRPLRPAAGEVIGLDDVDGARSSLVVRWAATAPSQGRPQAGARVQLEEVGGALRYDSGHLAGAADRHAVAAALADGRTYRWRVRVWDGATAVDSPWSTFTTAFRRAQVRALMPVEGETVESSPVLRWRSDAPQVSYRVWIDDDADHRRVLADSRELNGATGYHALRLRLEPGRTYWWRVGVFDGQGTSSLGPWTSFRTAPDYRHTAQGGALTVVALAPVGSATLPAGERPLLRWGYHAATDQRALRVQIDDLVEDGALLVDDRSPTNHSGYRPADRLPPGTYRWRVRVWDGEGAAAATAWETFVVSEGTAGLSGALGY